MLTQEGIMVVRDEIRTGPAREVAGLVGGPSWRGELAVQAELD